METASSHRELPPVARPLTAADAPAFAALCARHPLLMLTARMNLEALGFESQNARVWGGFTETGTVLQGVLMRFGNIAIVSDAEGICGEAFAALIDAEVGVAGIRGNVAAMLRVRDSLRRYHPTDWEESFFMQLPLPPMVESELLARVRPARPDDLDSLATLYAGAGIMYRSRANVASKLAETRVFVIEEPKTERRPARIVSCAMLNVEGKDAGMIGGVYTMPQARGHSYAAACTAAVSLDLQRDGKLPCLFYENPVAGRVYRRLGFENAGDWAILYVSPN